MRLKLISDGTPAGSRVVDAETGEALDGVVSWSLAPVDSVDSADVALRLTVTVLVADEPKPSPIAEGWIPAEADPRH